MAIDNRTPTYSWPLPNPGNNLIDDVARIIQAFGGVDTVVASIVAGLGAAASRGVGTANGQLVEVVGGKIAGSLIPEIAISRPMEVASQAAMLALTAEVGDVAIRTDGAQPQSFILGGTGDPTVLSNWKQFTFIDAVLSIAGLSGTVTDVALRNALGVFVAATITEFLSSAASRTLTPATVWGAAAYVNVPYAATMTLNGQAGVNFETTLTGNVSTLDLTNPIVGSTVSLYVIGDSATVRSITAFSSKFKGDLPSLTDITSSKAYELTIKVRGAAHFIVNAVRAL